MKTKNVRILAVLTVGGLLALGTFAQAQETNKPGKPPGDRQGPPGDMRRGDNMKEHLDKMAEDLGLSDDQKTKVQAAINEQREKMQALRNDTSLSQDDRRAKMKEMRDTMNEKMKTILTAEQYIKWEEMRPMRGQRPGGPGGPRGEGKPPGDKPADKTE